MGAKKAKRAAKVTETEQRQAEVRQSSMAKAKARRATLQPEPANDDVLAELARRVPYGRKVRIGTAYSKEAANDNPIASMVVQVEEIIRDAVSVVTRMPAGRYAFPSSGASGMPDVVRDYWESAKHVENELPREIPSEDEIVKAMAIITLLYKLSSRDRKIISARVMGFSYRVIAKEFRCSYEKVRSEYQTALFSLALQIADRD
nr:DUF6362 family protein [uncultured Dongia sp.]